jgi:pimeloyl-ACP methyl ester carboxylesterase
MHATAPDGIEVAYDVRGNGNLTVVLVHGWSCDRNYWQAQIEPLSRDYQVVTLDLAGHGQSGSARREWSIAAFGSDVAAVVAHLAVRDAVLVGHSMGGDVVLEAALQLPGRVRGIVWVDAYNQLARFKTAEQVRARMVPFETNFVETTRSFVKAMFPAGADPLLVQRVAADMSAAPRHIALPALESAWTFGSKVPEILESLKIPLVAINPEDPPTDLTSMHRYGVDVICVSGVGHFLMMERPERFNECLAQAVDSFASWQLL